MEKERQISYSRKGQFFRWYFVNLLLSIDQLLNSLMGGYHDETISSRIGKTKRRHGGTIPWRKYPLRRLLDNILEVIDEDHSIEAIEDDEGH